MVKWAKGCKVLRVPEAPVEDAFTTCIPTGGAGGKWSPHRPLLIVSIQVLCCSLSPNLSLRLAVSPTAPMFLFLTLRNDRILIEK